MNDSFRFVSFRSPTRGSRRDRRTPRGAAIRPRSPPPSRPRPTARRRVGVSRPRAIDATRRAKHRKTEKPKNRKIEKPKPKTNLDRDDLEGVRGSVKTLHTVSPHDTKTGRSDTHARRPASSRDAANPHAARDVERRGRSAGAGDGTRRGGASTTTRASDRRARGSARTARAGERRARDEGARAIGGEADDARRRRKRDGTGEGDRTTTTTRTMGSR